ncbi:MAG: Eco57I restriction-modification methylase domain-containing protein, partial [Promethearchaeota archaeon]
YAMKNLLSSRDHLVNNYTIELVNLDFFNEPFSRETLHDIIIGNPPYVSWKSIPKIDRRMFEDGNYLDLKYSCRPNHEDAQPNYYLFFLIKSTRLLEKNGMLSFILPNEWLYHSKAREFRSYLANHYEQINIVHFPSNFNFFRKNGRNVGTNTIIFEALKVGDGYLHFFEQEIFNDEDPVNAQEFIKYKIFQETKRKLNLVKNSQWNNLDPVKDEVINAIMDQDVILISDTEYFEIRGGFQPPVNKAKMFEIDGSTFNKLPEQEKKIVFPLIHDANEITRYVLSPKQERYWILGNDIKSESLFKVKFPILHEILSNRLVTNEKSWWHFPNIRNFDIIKNAKEKLLCPRVAVRPSFALDTSFSVFKGTNSMLVSKKLPIKYVLGILNSKLSEYWYKIFGIGYHGGKMKKFEPSKIRKCLIPIKRPGNYEIKRMVNLVDKILDLLAKSPKDHLAHEKLQDNIDSMVFQIYSIEPRLISRMNV